MAINPSLHLPWVALRATEDHNRRLSTRFRKTSARCGQKRSRSATRQPAKKSRFTCRRFLGRPGTGTKSAEKTEASAQARSPAIGGTPGLSENTAVASLE